MALVGACPFHSRRLPTLILHLLPTQYSNTAGPADTSVTFRNSTSVSVIGDWSGDGVDTTALFRPSNTTFYLFNQNVKGAPPDTVFTLGSTNGVALAGRGTRSDGTGIGLYANSVFYQKDVPSAGAFDRSFVFGSTGDIPVAGRWIP